MILRLLLLLLITVVEGTPVYAQLDEARKALANEENDQALLLVNEILSQSPNHVGALALKGRVLEEKAFSGQYAPAEFIQLIKEMVDTHTRLIEADESQTNQVQVGMTAFYKRAFEEGVQAYNQAQSTRDQELYEKAAGYFESCTMAAPDSTGPYINWTFALMAAGREDEAVKPLALAVERNLRDLDIFLYLARLYIVDYRADEAGEVLDKAKTIWPDNLDITLLSVNAYSMSGRGDEAVAIMEQIVADYPDNVDYRYTYGSILLGMEQYDAAISQLNTVVTLDDDHSEAYFTLGSAFATKAIKANENINRIDDDLRGNRGALSDSEIKAREAELEKLMDNRVDYFNRAVQPLEKARTLTEAAGQDAAEICKQLFQVYLQTEQFDKADAVRACAGF